MRLAKEGTNSSENKVAVPAKIERVSETLKTKVVDAIKQAYSIEGKQVNYVDPATNVSYLATYKENMLILSVVDEGPLPNASLLSFLTGWLGEPSTKYAKPWALDTSCTILFLFWQSPDKILSLKTPK